MGFKVNGGVRCFAPFAGRFRIACRSPQLPRFHFSLSCQHLNFYRRFSRVTAFSTGVVLRGGEFSSSSTRQRVTAAPIEYTLRGQRRNCPDYFRLDICGLNIRPSMANPFSSKAYEFLPSLTTG